MKGRSVAVMMAVMVIMSVGEAVYDLPGSSKCPTYCLHVCGGGINDGCHSMCDKNFCKEPQAYGIASMSSFLRKCPDVCIHMCAESKHKACGSACEKVFCTTSTVAQTKV